MKWFDKGGRLRIVPFFINKMKCGRMKTVKNLIFK